MATSQSFPTDWAQFYGPTAADSTAVSSAPTPTGPAHNIEGRVGKSGRRRPRASRRAPTTLLNTDPTNFRAMVQQFTGAPAGPYPDRSGPVINFGYGSDMGQAPAVGSIGTGPLGQYQYRHNQGQVYVDRGGVFPFSQGGISNNGFVQGFNLDPTDATIGSSGGVFLDGGIGNQVMMRGGHANEISGGFFL